jgi:ribonuclease HI
MSSAEMEMLPDFEDPDVHLEEDSIITEVPGIEEKDYQAPHLLKALALEMIDEQYNPSEWTHVFTDGSSEEAVKNGGAGIFIKHTDGRLTPRAFPTGKISYNYRAESTALFHAVETFSRSTSPPPKIVFFTDCRSLLQGLLNTRNEQQLQDTKKALLDLSRQSTIKLQWIPSHCGITGNEKADALSKAGSKMEQFSHPVTYREAKTIIHNQYRSQWKRRLGADNGEDSIHQLQRHQQTILFRLRTGHCRLLSHLNRLGIAHSDECPCGTGSQTPEHVLQHCPAHDVLRRQTWPEGTELRVQLWGGRHDLERTVGFIMATGLQV